EFAFAGMTATVVTRLRLALGLDGELAFAGVLSTVVAGLRFALGECGERSGCEGEAECQNCRFTRHWGESPYLIFALRPVSFGLSVADLEVLLANFGIGSGPKLLLFVSLSRTGSALALEHGIGTRFRSGRMDKPHRITEFRRSERSDVTPERAKKKPARRRVVSCGVGSATVLGASSPRRCGLCRMW